MVSKAFRLAVLLSAIATSPLLAPADRLAARQPPPLVGTGRRAGLRGLRHQPRRLLQHVVRLHEPQLRGRRSTFRSAPTTRSSRAAIAGSRRTSRRGATRTSSRSPCRRTSANRQLVWKLTAHGKTEQVVATLKPVWQIDRLRTTRGGNSEKISSNLPPVVNVRRRRDRRRSPARDARPCRRPTTACRSGAASRSA